MEVSGPRLLQPSSRSSLLRHFPWLIASLGSVRLRPLNSDHSRHGNLPIDHNQVLREAHRARRELLNRA